MTDQITELILIIQVIVYFAHFTGWPILLFVAYQDHRDSKKKKKKKKAMEC